MAISEETKYFLIFASLVMIPLVGQIFVNFLVLRKRHFIEKMGGTVKFFFSYFIFILFNLCVQLIAMCVLSRFLFLWLARKRITWEVQVEIAHYCLGLFVLRASGIFHCWG